MSVCDILCIGGVVGFTSISLKQVVLHLRNNQKNSLASTKLLFHFSIGNR